MGDPRLPDQQPKLRSQLIPNKSEMFEIYKLLSDLRIDVGNELRLLRFNDIMTFTISVGSTQICVHRDNIQTLYNVINKVIEEANAKLRFGTSDSELYTWQTVIVNALQSKYLQEVKTVEAIQSLFRSIKDFTQTGDTLES